MNLLREISEGTIKLLSDKSLEKRKMASAELIKEIQELEDDHSILKTIKYFGLLVDDESAQKRRSGLYGIGSIAVALYSESPKNSLLDFMLNPVLVGKSSCSSNVI